MITVRFQTVWVAPLFDKPHTNYNSVVICLDSDKRGREEQAQAIATEAADVYFALPLRANVATLLATSSDAMIEKPLVFAAIWIVQVTDQAG